MDKKKIVFISHLLGWLLLFSIIKFIETYIPVAIPRELEIRNNMHLLLLVTVFYCNYFLLLPQFLFKKRFISYSISILVLLFFVIQFNFIIYEFLSLDRVFVSFSEELREAFKQESIVGLVPNMNLRNTIGTKKHFLPYNFFSIMTVLFVLLLGTAIRFGQQWFQNERVSEEIQKDKLQTELSFLKSQINPHFFFNMLNNIYSLINTDPDKAQVATHKLSKLMRYVLYKASDKLVTLATEISFIGSYIELARIRFSEGVSVIFEYDIEDERVLIPPLIFVPFIENIFKHGLANNDFSEAMISLKQEEEEIHFYSRNSINQNSLEKDERGIGLQNVSRRLDLLYGSKYSLDINADSEFYTVNLKIHVNED